MGDTFGELYGTHGAFGYLGIQLLPPIFSKSIYIAIRANLYNSDAQLGFLIVILAIMLNKDNISEALGIFY